MKFRNKERNKLGRSVTDSNALLGSSFQRSTFVPEQW